MNRLPIQVVLAVGALTTLAGTAPAGQMSLAQRAELFTHVQVSGVQADTNGNRIFDSLEAKIAAPRGEKQLQDVIVRYKPGQEGLAARIEGRVTRHLEQDDSVAARLTGEEIRRLVASGAVQSIEENAILHATRDTAAASFGAAKASVDFGLTGDRDGNPDAYSAQDVTIAVIDSGIDAAHPDFPSGKILAWQDFVNGRATPYDDNGHGTHCASIAAGAVRIGVGGVAPGASLVILKVLNAEGSGSSDSIASAVDWCVENKDRYGIDVVNMSLGGSQSSDGTDVTSRAVDRASAAGLVVCVAAGNNGPAAYTIGSPAAAASAITVGNMVDAGKGGFVIYPGSSRGPTADGRVKPDICGPGTDILAAEANTGDYTRKTGTSMACPFVAGVAALMLQAEPTLTPGSVKTVMKATAVHFGPPGLNSEFGAGRLNGYLAIASATGNVGTAPPAPTHLYGTGVLAEEGASTIWSVPVVDNQFAIAVSLIMADADIDFDLYLYNPFGEIVAESEGTTRQETLMLRPAHRGVYQLEVVSFSGRGHYHLDVSAETGLQ